MLRTQMDWLIASLPIRGAQLGEKLLGVIEAYLDESGINGDHARSCMVGGYVGGYRQFRSLETSWRKIASCLPDGDFHAKRFFGRDASGERLDGFKGWSDKRAKDFIDRLIDAIHAVAIHPIGAGADVSEFFQRDLDERVYLTGGRKNPGKWETSGSPHSPYYLPFQHAVTQAVNYAKAHIKLNLICDQQNVLAPWAICVFNDLKLVHEQKLGAISHTSRLDTVIIQAADLITHAHYRHKSNPTNETEYVLARLIEKENNFRFYDAKHIESVLASFQPPQKKMSDMNPQAHLAELKRRERRQLERIH